MDRTSIFIHTQLSIADTEPIDFDTSNNQNMASLSKSFFAVVAGAGAGTGGAVSTLQIHREPRTVHVKSNAAQKVAKRFAQTYPVVLLARNKDTLDPLVTEINNNGGKALGVQADTSDPASVKAAFQTVAAELSGLKLAAAVFNVGAGMSFKPFLELQLEELQTSLKGNA